jgi:hypothetical protein
MSFSQRIGEKPVKEIVQLRSMDDDLRNSLWNIFYMVYVSGEISADYFNHYVLNEKRNNLYRSIWLNLFKLPLDDIPYRLEDTDREFRRRFLKSEWFNIYEFIEHIIQFDDSQDGEHFSKLCNHVLEKELSGYRIIDGIVAPITNTEELNEIEDVLDHITLSGVNEHIKAALSMLSDKENPDYRNSIKESISAVESIAKRISGNPKSDLAAALKQLDSKIDIHKALRSGFASIYGYTSDQGGIRHALHDLPTCDFEDAKYMLVSCSAFINYLIVKSSKAGINFS